jgi:hypothetical protein
MKIINKPYALWNEGNLWYGWAFSHKKNKYVFDDLGYESCTQLLKSLYSFEYQIDEVW